MSEPTTAYSPHHVDALAVIAKTAVQAGLIPSEAGRAMLRDLRVRAGTTDHVEAPPRLLRAKEVAARLSTSPKTVLRMAKTGELTPVHMRPGVAKSLRFREAEVSALVGAAR